MKCLKQQKAGGKAAKLKSLRLAGHDTWECRSTLLNITLEEVMGKHIRPVNAQINRVVQWETDRLLRLTDWSRSCNEFFHKPPDKGLFIWEVFQNWGQDHPVIEAHHAALRNETGEIKIVEETTYVLRIRPQPFMPGIVASGVLASHIHGCRFHTSRYSVNSRSVLPGGMYLDHRGDGRQ